MLELSTEIYEKIKELCSDGDCLTESSQFDDAITKYLEALSLVPENKCDWEASTWIYAAIGDACFLKGDFTSAKNYFYDARNCPDGIANPFILLRIGESCAELDELNGAQEFLLRAYMLEGEEIFEGESEKYFEIIKDIV